MSKVWKLDKWYKKTVYVMGWIFSVLFALSTALFVYVVSVELDPPGAVQTTVYQQDPTLLGIANELGVDVSRVTLIMVDKPVAGDVKDATGVFIAPNTIHVQPGLPLQETRTIVAHEYMHYVWATLSEENHNSLISNYTNYHSNNPLIQKYLAQYTCGTACLANEANAFACTFIPPYIWTQAFNDYCNRFIPNRSLLFQ